MCVDIKHVNINACEYQCMWTWEHAIIQAYEDDSMVSSVRISALKLEILLYAMHDIMFYVIKLFYYYLK